MEPVLVGKEDADHGGVRYVVVGVGYHPEERGLLRFGELGFDGVEFVKKEKVRGLDDLIDSGFYHVESILDKAGFSNIVTLVGKRLGISCGISDLGSYVYALFPEDRGYSVPDSGFVYDDVWGRVYFGETGDEIEEENGLELPVEFVRIRDDVGEYGRDMSVSAFQ